MNSSFTTIEKLIIYGIIAWIFFTPTFVISLMIPSLMYGGTSEITIFDKAPVVPVVDIITILAIVVLGGVKLFFLKMVIVKFQRAAAVRNRNNFYR